MKNTRKNRKKKRVSRPQKPKSYRYTLYEREKSSQVLASIVSVVFFAFGIGVVFEEEYLTALIPISLAGIVAYSLITEVKKIEIFEDTMFVQYLDSTSTYSADEILSAEWILVEVIRRHRIPYFHEFTPKLLIKTKNGKKIQVPPPGGYDIQKSIMSWKEKYQNPSDSQEISLGN